ncbi:hypothetical protein [Pseudomonas tohonis]|uniref:hypothetical protein n=1 Tax=Pseudomonas tohonis TaxID=2725477 RepID=UPI0035A21BDE
MAWSLLGMGDDLPLGVYRDWKRWCRQPHYYFDDPGMAHVAGLYASVRTPCVFATSVDDPWAPPRSRDAFVKGYSNAPLTRRDLHPPQGGEPIGHMGYFRAGSEPLWDDILKWLLAHAPQRLPGTPNPLPAEDMAMPPLLQLHLFAVAFWLGVVAVEFLLEQGRATSRAQGFTVARMHRRIDLFFEMPAFSLALVTGLLIEPARFDGLYALKVVAGLVAVAGNALCLVPVLRRRSR